MPRLRKTMRLDVKDEDPNVYNPGVNSNSRRAYMPAYIARDLGYEDRKSTRLNSSHSV